jgi:LCP family protein required for cell wall assembly
MALSFLWPGLGQWYLGRPRAAALFALPIVAVVAAFVLMATGGIEGLAANFLNPSFDLVVLTLIVLAALWRLFSMADALGSIGRIGNPSRRTTQAAFASLAVIVIAVHAMAGYYTWSFYDASNQIFVAPPPSSSPSPSLATGTPYAGDAGFGTAPPVPTPAPDNLMTVLITGIDSGEGRDHALNDTMIVVTLDKNTDKVSMLSFPRDLTNVPMYDGGTYPAKLNSLMTAAYLNPKKYPDGPAGTLMNELGYLLGIPVTYYASINLDGFVTLINSVGGVDVVNPKPINDPTWGDAKYGWVNANGGPSGLYLPAGPLHLDGRTALAYVRSRKGVGDSDFTRAARQQDVLVALKKKLTSPAMLPRLPEVLRAAAQTIRTNFPSDQVSTLIQLAKQVSNPAVTKIVLGPPYAYSPPLAQTNGVYTLDLYLNKLQALSVRLFGSASSYWTPPATPSPTPTP